jgi:putative transposase
MADEITQNPAAADTAAVAPIASAPEKKKRAPRTPKVAPTTAPVAAATTGRGRKSAAVKADETKPDAQPVVRRRGKAKVEGPKVDGRKRAAAQTAATVAISSAADEMTELLKLEDENKRLRKQLGDKLRAENVDLRKKLGVK